MAAPNPETAASSPRFAGGAHRLVEHLVGQGIDGVRPLRAARVVAGEASRHAHGDVDAAVRTLIRAHVDLAGSQGFATNVGGAAVMPFGLPANVTAAFLTQAHLAAAIAFLWGHDLDDEHVRAAVLLCLAGNAAGDALKKVGIVVGANLSIDVVEKFPPAVLGEISKRLGFMLVTKYGTSRAPVVVARAVPAVGGVICGGIDAAATRAVALAAVRMFSDARGLRSPHGHLPR
jgi:hypothetical protein